MSNYINLNQVNGYIAQLVFNQHIDGWDKNNLSYNEMKQDFIQKIGLNENDHNNNIIFYECLFYFIKNKNEDKNN